MAGRSVHTGQNSRQARGTTKRYRRPISSPAPTLTGQARCWWVQPDQVIRPAARCMDCGHVGPTHEGDCDHCGGPAHPVSRPAERECAPCLCDKGDEPHCTCSDLHYRPAPTTGREADNA